MAAAVALSVAGGIVAQLASQAFLELMRSVWGIEDELEKLKDYVLTTQALLLDAEAKYDTSHGVADWVRRLKDSFLDVEDLLDEISTAALLHQQRSNAVSKFFSCSNPSFLLKFMAGRIKKTREEIETIMKSRPVELVERPIDDGRTRRRRELTHSFVPNGDIIGREDDKTEIIKLLLLDTNVEEAVSIIPIVGIGGLGKTALAQCVFNDDTVQNHFDVKIWACVSEIFDLKSIMRQIIAGGSDLEVEQLQTQLRQKIDGKKYLLILDDLWTENREEWLSLKSLLMGGANGSKILTTTRLNVVARISGTVREPYVLGSLSDEKSWALFVKMAFQQGEEGVEPEMISIEKEILGKCKGVPLAIRTLGCLLFKKDTKKEWLSIKDKELQDISTSKEDKNGIIPILKLSYDHLPSHLKQCFAICSLFPTDSLLEKHLLIRLWMAQGFIPSRNPEEDLEGVGEEYFMDLVQMNFFQDLVESDVGDVRCKMHDLMHDLAKSVSGELSTSFVRGQERGINARTLHLSVGSSFVLADVIPNVSSAKRLRTVFLPRGWWKEGTLTDSHLSMLRCLRHLDLHGTDIKVLPKSISKLKHLRYFDLSFCSFKKLPNSIVKLVHLQTLILYYCYKLEELPRHIERLVSLRYLDVSGCRSLKYMHKGIGKLTSLHMLPFFVLSDKVAPPKYCAQLSNLGGHNNLRGRLEIVNLASLEINSLKPNQEILLNKNLITSLRLSFLLKHGREPNGDHEALLKELQPHPNLVVLTLYRYEGKEFPSWISGGCLPKLRVLCLYDYPKLVSLPEEVSQLKSLQSLRIVDCPKLEEACKRETGPDWHKIKHVPVIRHDYNWQESYGFSLLERNPPRFDPDFLM